MRLELAPVRDSLGRTAGERAGADSLHKGRERPRLALQTIRDIVITDEAKGWIMDGLFVLLGLAVLAIPVAVVVLLFGQSSLRARVKSLEGRLAELGRAAGAADLAAAPSGSAEAVLTEAAVAALAPQVEQVGREASPERSPAEALPDQPASPWVAAARAAEGAPAPSDQDRPIVMRADRLAALTRWLSQNWVYAVSGLSLALAGVFLVQYSVQNGLLPPLARVVLALAFGAALIGAGEWVRRRSGDGEDSDTAYIPSIFSGAGIVSIFAATVAARQLYGLIGGEVALAGHVATAALAIVLGWFNGPLLVALGLLGAAVAPFAIGSTAAPGTLTYGYFGLIAVTGLGVDAVRRWAWVSVLALVLGYGGGALMWLGNAGDAGGILALVGLALVAVAVPLLRLVPAHDGPTIAEALLGKSGGRWPIFPVRIAGGAVLASTLGLLMMPGDSALAGLLAFAGLAALALALLLWAERAPGLWDLAALPAVALPLRIWLEAEEYRPLLAEFMSKALTLRPPETAPSHAASMVLGLATLVTLASAWRALQGGRFGVAFGLGAVLVAPVAAAGLELFWLPAEVLGPYPWALQVMALAALMVGLALRFAQRDAADRRRAAHATLAALSLVALSVFVLTTQTALTLALAILVAAAAGLDRRFRLPEMGWFIQIAVAVLSWRLLVEPGLGWALEAPLLPVLAAFGGVILAQVVALWLIRPLGRLMTVGVLESAALALAVILADVLLARWLVAEDSTVQSGLETWWGVSLLAMPWLALLLVQGYRLRFGGPLALLRRGIAAGSGLLAGLGFGIAALPLSPLWASDPGASGALVRGPLVLDTLALAYGAPGLILLLAAPRMAFGRWVRLGMTGFGAALLMLYAGLEIRRVWQGDWLGRPGVSQAELYTYTVALMILGAALLYQAIARRSPGLRRIGMAVIAVTIAKVFLIDASGLTGLTRVFSFLGLGLSLAGLAWLNRWAGQAAGPDEKP